MISLCNNYLAIASVESQLPTDTTTTVPATTHSQASTSASIATPPFSSSGTPASSINVTSKKSR